MKYIKLIAVVALVVSLTSCTVGVNENGKVIPQLDADSANRILDQLNKELVEATK